MSGSRQDPLFSITSINTHISIAFLVFPRWNHFKLVSIIESYHRYPISCAFTGVPSLPTCSKEVGPSEIRLPIDWQKTQPLQYIQDAMVPAAQFQRAVCVTEKHGDKPKVKLHVIIKWNNMYQIGKIIEILVPFEQRIASHIIISLLKFLLELHPHLCVPHIQYRTPEHRIVVSPFICSIQTVYFMVTNLAMLGYNLHGQCTTWLHDIWLQFNDASLQMPRAINHLTNEGPCWLHSHQCYILNTYLLHNYEWLISAIPSSTHNQSSVPLISNHASLHLDATNCLCSKKVADNPGEEAKPSPFEQKKTHQKGKGKERQK